MKSICFVVSSPMTVKAFLLRHIEALSLEYDVTVAANLSGNLKLDGIAGCSKVINIPIVRQISPFRDMRALFCLWRAFRSNKFDVVHSVTPKAGLLAMMAAFLAGTKHRIHTYTGQVWVTRSGFGRWILKSADRMYGRLATRVYVDSESQRQFLVDENVISVLNSSVLALGSISGVDASRFRPDENARKRIRSSLNIPMDAFLSLCVGRLNCDKGVLDLARAFANTAKGEDGYYILFVGPDEGGLRGEIEESCTAVADRVRFVDFTDEPESYMAAADILCLPSYREGFGSVVIEAAAVGVPAVASRIYGVTDAVLDEKTGLLHTAGDVNGIASHLKFFSENPERRLAMGAAAKERAVADFSADRVARALVEEYKRILQD